MKYYIIVLSIILFVLLTFFTPTLIEDASFSTYDYLHNFRRTSQARNDDHPNDGWQKDGTFNPIHIIEKTDPDGSKSIIKEDGYSYRDDKVRDDIIRYNTDHRDKENESKNETNLLPYLLLILLLLVTVIAAVKYYLDSNKNPMN